MLTMMLTTITFDPPTQCWYLDAAVVKDETDAAATVCQEMTVARMLTATANPSPTAAALLAEVAQSDVAIARHQLFDNDCKKRQRLLNVFPTAGPKSIFYRAAPPIFSA
jgi:hypothetical protein